MTRNGTSLAIVIVTSIAAIAMAAVGGPRAVAAFPGVFYGVAILIRAIDASTPRC